MKTTLPTLVSLFFVFFLQLSICHGAPRKPLNTYDQRQDGKYNVHAKLDNFLIVIAPTSSAGSGEFAGLLQNDLIAQALELKNVASRITGNHERENDNEESRKIIEIIEKLPNDEKHEVTREKLPKNAADTVKSLKVRAIVRKNLPVDLETSEQLSEPADNKKNSNDDTTIDLQTDNANFGEGKLKKSARSLKNVSHELLGSKLPSRDDGLSPLENKVTDTGNERGNDVGSAEREPQELKLLGGGIENCGPERFRDRFGICRFRVEP